MKILYVGPQGTHTTSRHRAEALRRLGHEVEIVDPDDVLPRNRFRRHFNYRTGYRFAAGSVQRLIESRVGKRKFDVGWVNGGYSVSGACVRSLRRNCGQVLNYANDDPTGPRDPSNWATFRASIPDYDLCVVVRDVSRVEFLAAGAKRVLQIKMSYDEVAHAPLAYSAGDAAKWSSDVIFVGTWMPERGPFFAELVRRGVPLAIYGDKWSKAKEWPALQTAYRGGSASGADYVRAIQYAKVAVGLLSKGNRDEHTTRSSEIPYIGSVLCAERTPEHRQMFTEDVEAVFWSTPEECASQCVRLLADPALRDRIAAAGHARVLVEKLGNEDACRRILSELPGAVAAPRMIASLD